LTTGARTARWALPETSLCRQCIAGMPLHIHRMAGAAHPAAPCLHTKSPHPCSLSGAAIPGAAEGGAAHLVIEEHRCAFQDVLARQVHRHLAALLLRPADSPMRPHGTGQHAMWSFSCSCNKLCKNRDADRYATARRPELVRLRFTEENEPPMRTTEAAAASARRAGRAPRHASRRPAPAHQRRRARRRRQTRASGSHTARRGARATRAVPQAGRPPQQGPAQPAGDTRCMLALTLPYPTLYRQPPAAPPPQQGPAQP